MLKLSAYNLNHLRTPIDESLYEVRDAAYVSAIENYLLGLQPGSFHTKLFANMPIWEVISSSHPLNSIHDLKTFSNWVVWSGLDNIAFGSIEIVKNWLALSAEERRAILEKQQFILPESEEIFGIIESS